MVEENSCLTRDELSRYNRQIILPDIGPSGQEKLKGSRVLIIGMGGLGSPACLYLAAAGVGTLGLADTDTVEAHNLQRQIIHDTPHVGKLKLESASEKIQKLNPYCSLQFHPEGIQPHNALEIFKGYDLILDGSDNFGTRYLVNDTCYLAQKPLVYGSIFQFEGQVSFFHPTGGTPCYRCLFPVPPEPGTIPNCEEAGVFGALAGVIGCLQSMETVKWITGVGENLSGRLLIVDSLTMGFRKLNLKKDPDCPLCGNTPHITEIRQDAYSFECSTESGDARDPDAEIDMENPPFEINIQQARELIETPGIPIHVLDVREPHEVEICSIEGSSNIPLGTLGDRWKSIPPDQPVLVLCHHGGRSSRATQLLRDKGVRKAMNIAGGIDQWAVQVDPTMKRY